MTETDYQKLLKGFITVSDMLSLMYNIPSDMDYPKALNIYAKQQQILSNEETKKFNEKFQTEKFKEDLKLRKAGVGDFCPIATLTMLNTFKKQGLSIVNFI